MKRDLLLGFVVLAGFSGAQALTSPYAGSVPAEGTFYLYQVETGQWLQPNIKIMDMWDTHASLDAVGMDVELRKLDGFEGYQIFCNFTNNGSLNGADQDRFYLDQPDRDITDWIFEPVTVAGLTNTYKIMAKATPEGTGERSVIANNVYIGATEGELSDQPTDMTWQLVSREERLEKMVAASANGPQDATWLIPGSFWAGNDRRADLWTKTVNNPQGGGLGFNGPRGYRVQEYWHQITMRQQITLTDLPKGTYAFSVQAYYRDTEIESEELAQRHLDGNENLRVNYFIGGTSGKVMSIFDNAKTAQTDGYNYFVEKCGLWVPNNMDEAALSMFNGAYINEYIKAPVADGTVVIGIEKPEAEFHDWLIQKRFFLQYVGTELIAEDLTPLRDQLTALITEAKELPQTPTFVPAIEEAEKSLNEASSSTALMEAISKLKEYVDVIKASKDVINAFAATKAITDGLGIDPAEALEQFNNATTKANYEEAVRTLRYARRLKVADCQEDLFAGNPVAEGKFYLYNVGRGQFLCGGADWGAHAALGMPGVELTIQDMGISERTGLQKYLIETGLYNGDKHHLNYRGYMDAPDTDGFAFIPVEGKENVYYIVQGDYEDVHMAWNPYAGTDGGNNDETTVGTECRNLDLGDLNAQWKLVSRAEREALMEKASIDNPVDVTFLIASPNFNQREQADVYWGRTGFNIWEYGGNHYDFVCEAYNTDKADLSQMIEGLPAGVYKVCVQGYYRNGELNNQVNADATQLAIFYAGNDTSDDVLLPNIMTESGKAPYEGGKATSDDATLTIEVPNSCIQATNFFKAGLYKTYTVIEKPDENELPIGIIKESKEADGDWVVVDNFRIYYYGAETTKDAVKENIESGVEDVVTFERAADDRIFNLHGIQVKNPTAPGIYICNGKKFIVR